MGYNDTNGNMDRGKGMRENQGEVAKEICIADARSGEEKYEGQGERGKGNRNQERVVRKREKDRRGRRRDNGGKSESKKNR